MGLMEARIHPRTRLSFGFELAVLACGQQNSRNPMKLLFLLLFWGLAVHGFADDVSKLVERLPTIRKKALRDTAKLREGSTVDMVDAAVKVRLALLPQLVSLEAALNKESEEKTKQVIERDLEAIARDADIRGHAEGWGGTSVTVDAAWVVVTHLERRISWCVWQLMRDQESFDLEHWLECWNGDSE